YLNGRWHEAPTPWDYRALVEERKNAASAMVDMGTGGGEFLASLLPLPARTCATEAYPPNVPVAKARLEPLGVEVGECEEDEIPFEDAAFDLVINRHESFAAPEVARVLRPGGRFLTQQAGGKDCIELNHLLHTQVEKHYLDWTPDAARAQLEEAGFTILRQEE